VPTGEGVDPRIQAAVQNWAPRMVAQGVDYNDFVRTTSAVERWEDWLDAWVRTGDVHAHLAQEAESRGRRVTAGEAWVRAALCYHFAKFVWTLDEVRYRETTLRAVEALRSAHRHLDPTARRLEVPFEGAMLFANLRRPVGVLRPPLVVLVPGLDSTKEEFFHWENTFLARGMATVSVDGPGQGETGFHTHIRADYEVAVRALLDRLEEDAEVDTERVGAVGVSLGAYYAPRAAAFEPRIRAVAAIGGPYNFGAAWERLPNLTRETFRYHAGAQDEEEARRRALELDLGPVLPQLRQPLLVVFGQQDLLFPWQDAERVAREAHRGEFVLYPEGNHVCNNIPYKYRPLVADWMAEQLS
jgi:pimeloyl-ACP methyl ester carboxylesterase